MKDSMSKRKKMYVVFIYFAYLIVKLVIMNYYEV